MSQSAETANDKFKVDETAPFFPIGPMGPTGSYSSGSFKSEYVLKFKDNQTKSVIRTSGIVGSNLNTVPIPVPPTLPITILRYSDSSAGSIFVIFVWAGVTWTFDSTLPNYSWSANATNLTQNVPNSSSLISVAIGTSLTSIGESVFRNCTSLTSITIPNSVTSISENAFRDCESLTSITIPNSVTSIGNGAFSGCSSLTSISIPDSVTSIGDNVFQDCISLSSITIPNSVTSIGDGAFINSGLTTVTINNNQIYDPNGNQIPSPASNVNFFGRTVQTILP